MHTNLHKSLILLVIFLTAAFTPSCYTQQPSSSSYDPSETSEKAPVRLLESEILSYINKYRASKGLSPLTSHSVIAKQAADHSADMASKKTSFSHDGFETRIKNISQVLGAISGSAENVAFGELSAKQVVDLWLKSPGHRKNIEGKFQLTGIGMATAKDGNIYFTQIFTR